MEDLDLTEQEYDALYQLMHKQMPRVPRDLFPLILTTLAEQGRITIAVTDDRVTVTSPSLPGRIYQVERTK